jgi:hypothetical protein
VTWALYELVRHPDVMRELRAEIAHRGGPSVPPDQSQIEDMEFLNGVVQETMRLHASGALHILGSMYVTLTLKLQWVLMFVPRPKIVRFHRAVVRKAHLR